MFRKLGVYMACCFMWLSLSIADHHSVGQQHSQSSLENDHHDDDKHYHTQHAAVFAGVTINLHTEENSPTLGADWEYRLPLLNHGMGFGMITDLVFTEATEFIVAPAVFLHPLAGLKFAVAPGFIFTKDIETSTKGDGIHGAPFLAKSEENHNPSPLIVRLGLAYDIHLGKTSLSPTLNADLIHEHWSLAFGLAFGLGF